MKYIAHTKETIPVLNPIYTEEFNPMTDSLKSIQISPDHISAFIDGKEYDESEFEVKINCPEFALVFCSSDNPTCRNCREYAIPKQKEESQQDLWNQIITTISGQNYSKEFIYMLTTQLKSKYSIKRK